MRVILLSTVMLLLVWSASAAAQPVPGGAFVGSVKCQSQTRMANVVTDPKAHPEVIIPDLAKADPPLSLTRDDTRSSTAQGGSSGTSRR